MYTGTRIEDLTKVVEEAEKRQPVTRQATEAEWARFLAPDNRGYVVEPDLDDYEAERHF